MYRVRSKLLIVFILIYSCNVVVAMVDNLIYSLSTLIGSSSHEEIYINHAKRLLCRHLLTALCMLSRIQVPRVTILVLIWSTLRLAGESKIEADRVIVERRLHEACKVPRAAGCGNALLKSFRPADEYSDFLPFVLLSEAVE